MIGHAASIVRDFLKKTFLIMASNECGFLLLKKIILS
jgi:hypothetical protein